MTWNPRTNAGAYLTPLDPGERYFATILCAISTTSNNSSLQATAATGAAHFEIPSTNFYKGKRNKWSLD
jgi:hypothetical protein